LTKLKDAKQFWLQMTIPDQTCPILTTNDNS